MQRAGMGIKKITTVKPRRIPSQARSRETIEKILGAAEELAASEGAEAVQVRRIASSASLPIGSIYLYFPNREAILRAIIDRYHARIDADFAAKLEGIQSREELLEVVDTAVVQYAQFIRDTPSFLNIWTGSSATRLLSDLSIEDSRRTAEILYHAARPYISQEQAQNAHAGLLICVDIIGSISLIAAGQSKKEGERTIQELQKMIRFYVVSLLPG